MIKILDPGEISSGSLDTPMKYKLHHNNNYLKRVR